MFLRSLEIVRAEEARARGEYPFTVPTISSLKQLAFQSNVTFFVGENGSGKSTLLEGIADACEFNTAGGGRNNLYDVDEAQSVLGKYLRLSWMPKVNSGFFLRAETFYQFASHLMRDVPESLPSYGGKSLHEQSHGESFLSLFTHRFGGKGLYLLDEPEAALSPTRQLSLLRIIKDLENKAQFIIATHSPILLGYPGAEIFSFDSGEVERVRYEETMHYIMTKRFLDNREGVLRELFADD